MHFSCRGGPCLRSPAAAGYKPAQGALARRLVSTAAVCLRAPALICRRPQYSEPSISPQSFDAIGADLRLLQSLEEYIGPSPAVNEESQGTPTDLPAFRDGGNTQAGRASSLHQAMKDTHPPPHPVAAAAQNTSSPR